MNAQDILSKLKAAQIGDNGYSICLNVGTYYGSQEQRKANGGVGSAIHAYLHLGNNECKAFTADTYEDVAAQIDAFLAKGKGSPIPLDDIDKLAASLVAPSTPHPDEADEEHAAYLAHAKQEVADDVASKCYHDTRS